VPTAPVASYTLYLTFSIFAKSIFQEARIAHYEDDKNGNTRCLTAFF
jgi:hypothetical protein